MLNYLEKIFGGKIIVKEYDYPSGTPFFIRDGYDAHYLLWEENQCVLLTPNFPWRLPTIKKQLLKFQEICPLPCALCIENVTALQRRNLVENRIPFVSLSQQVYLPFWGCFFFEHFKAETSVPDKMAPGTQLVFLYLYYLQSQANINLTQISKNLMLSKATCTRAIDDLTASGLINQRKEGTNKWITPAYDKPEFLKKGYSRLKSPVERYIYVKDSVSNSNCLKSGMLALAEISMTAANEYDGAIALSRKAASKIPADDICSELYFKDFGGYTIEVWSYDPVPLAQNGQVDDISLLLSLDNNQNERVQMGLDEIREKHELPVKYEE